MIHLVIDADIKAAERGLRGIERKVIPKAVSRTLNEVRSTVATYGAKRAAAEVDAAQWAMKRRYLKGWQAARPGRLTVVFNVGLFSIPLDKSRTTKRGKQYAFGQPEEEGRGVTAGDYYVHHGFFATVPTKRAGTSHHGVFERFGPKRVATSGRYAGQRRQAIRKPRVEVGKPLQKATDVAIDVEGADRWRKRFKHHWRHELRKVWGR